MVIFSPYLPLSSHVGYFLLIIAFLSKEKSSLTNHKLLPRLQAVLLEWKNRNTERKDLQGGFLFIFPMVNVLYGIYVYRMYLPCDVKQNEWQKKKFWCAIWKFALASQFMFFFSVLYEKKKKKTGCILKLY